MSEIPYLESVLSATTQNQLNSTTKLGSKEDTGHPLDKANFSKYELLNQLIPTETDLDKLDLIKFHLKAKIKEVDVQLQSLLRSQLDQASDAEEMAQTKLEMEALIEQIESLGRKAEEAESVVVSITKGIKGLDLAKRNVVQTITFSRRLQMLVAAVNQLKVATEHRHYTESGHLLQAVIELFLHFQNFRNIRPIYELREVIAQQQTTLLNNIMDDFKQSFDSLGQLQKPIDRLVDACTIVEFAHADGKKQIVDFYTQLQLKDYVNTFSTTDEVASLENTPQRYAWLKRFLITYEQSHHSIFPQHWAVDFYLCQKFCEITCQDLTNWLESTSQENVSLVVKIMLVTVSFELQLDKKFAGLEQILPDGQLKLEGTISCCFEPYLHHYLDREDLALQRMFESFQSQPPAPDTESEVQVLASSTQLLLFYQDTLNTLSKVTKGKPLLQLSQLLLKWLQTYADHLQSLLKEDKRILSTDDFNLACLTLNTATYCHETTQQLESRVQSLIDSLFAEQVNFQPVLDRFLDINALAIKCIVRACELRTEPGFTMLSKVAWAGWNSLGEPAYRTQLITALVDSSLLVRGQVHYPNYFRTFCDRFAQSFIVKWADTVIKLKRLPEVAVQQLGEDSKILLEQLCQLPVVGTSETAPTTYVKAITRLFHSKLGNYLDILSCKLTLNPEPELQSFTIDFENFFAKFIKFAPDPKFPFFLWIMEVKGIKRSDQTHLREALKTELVKLDPQSDPTSFEEKNLPNLDQVSTNSPLPVELPNIVVTNNGATSTSSTTPATAAATSAPNSTRPSFQNLTSPLAFKDFSFLNLGNNKSPSPPTTPPSSNSNNNNSNLQRFPSFRKLVGMKQPPKDTNPNTNN